jgi:cellulose biosynthesis protein BcsQ
MTKKIAISNQKGDVAKTAMLRESPGYGQPITLYVPKTRGAEQYRALAKELLTDVR